MDGSQYSPRFDQPVYGVVIGEGNIVNINPPTSTSPSYRGIMSIPPPTDSRTIQQRRFLVEKIYARLMEPGLNALVFTGIGGVGKSTLAALVYRYAETQQETGPFVAHPLWLSIDAAATFADLVGTIFQAIEKPLPNLNGLSPTNQAQILFNALATAKSPRLIVLDQFEHLLDWKTGAALSDRPGVGEWLDTLNSEPWTSSCRMLLTSRPRPKGTRQEVALCIQEHEVGGLEIVEGVDLLRSRGVLATEADLRKAVSFCNGHALSLTLLVTLMQDYRMSIADLINDATLWVGNIAENLLDATFTRLSEIQRDLLRAFSVYRLPVPVEAAQAVLGKTSKGQLLLTLKTLLAQHLLQAAGEGRYQLHNIVARYTKQHFVEADEQANEYGVQEAHAKAAQYYIKQAEKHAPPREQRRQVIDVQTFIEAVWQYCQAARWHEAYTLLVQEELLEDLKRWGGYTIMLELCQLLLPHEGWQPRLEEAVLISYNLGESYSSLGQMSQAITWFGQVLTTAAKIGNHQIEGAALNGLGLAYKGIGQLQEALNYFQLALSISRQVGDRPGEGAALNNLGGIYHDMGQLQEALECYQQALPISQGTGDRYNQGVLYNNLGRIYHDIGQLQEALDYFQRVLVIRREMGDRPGEGVTLTNLGGLFQDQGQLQEALDCYQQALIIFREVGDRIDEGFTLSGLGSIYSLLKKLQESLICYQEALVIFQEVGNRREEGKILNNLGNIYRDLGNSNEAWNAYHQALIIVNEVGDRPKQGAILLNIGMFLFRHQHYEHALRTLLVAKQIFEEVASPYQNSAQKWIDELRQAVGEEQFVTLQKKIESESE